MRPFTPIHGLVAEHFIRHNIGNLMAPLRDHGRGATMART